ncbi:hypothetical protein MCHI_000218 [Candidatus Magnetoovum chiemensis]|nr:hypothetical protein MCHI_000218 [Candidatus Magnetoovum chiemensis]
MAALLPLVLIVGGVVAILAGAKGSGLKVKSKANEKSSNETQKPAPVEDIDEEPEQ